MKTCMIEGCERKPHSYGMCSKHREQSRTDLDKKTRNLWRNHKTLLEDAQTLWKNQGARCACCLKQGPEDYLPSPAWVIDHDWGCCPGNRSCGNCNRGIVCMLCNQNALSKHLTKEVWEATGRYLGYV